MKIIFFGSGKFAVTILKTLHTLDHKIELIVTQPDRKKGRHLHWAATPVKEYAIDNNMELLQAENINSEVAVNLLRKSEPDVFIVVSYGRILSKEVLAIPKKICVNIHASLLPKYRGAAPIQWALINGESKTGITYIRMNELMDQGDILLQKGLTISKNDRADSLEERLAQLASKYLRDVLNQVDKNRLNIRKQNHKDATFAPRIKKQDGLIRWESPAQEIINRFKGCFGWPASFTYFKGKILKVFEMEKGRHKNQGRPGEILLAFDNTLEVACLKGSIVIREVLPESHHRMPIKSFLAGHEVKIGDVLTTA